MYEFLHSPPSHQRVAFWAAKCNTPFDPISGVQSMVEKPKEIKCPSCLHPFFVAYMDSIGFGEGYIQHKFTTRCPNFCGLEEITEEKLGSLPNTPQDQAFSNAAQARVLNSVGLRLQITMVMIDGGPNRLLVRVMSAYSDDKPYSLDLVGAVSDTFLSCAKARLFRRCMTSAGPEKVFFEEQGNEVVLQRAISRYHAVGPEATVVVGVVVAGTITLRRALVPPVEVHAEVGPVQVGAGAGEDAGEAEVAVGLGVEGGILAGVGVEAEVAVYHSSQTGSAS
ncbi:hypothetical protein BJ165DRAFT_1561497 [Panaeolus papilionaceus]|nr:hypothetical protein BJ165DRAFT_1561497 [Panaeolus papilionaceus]